MKRTPPDGHARTLLHPLLLLLLAFGLNGCTGYRLGSMLPPQYATVHIPTFENLTDEPFLQTPTTNAAIQEFQLDGSLRVTGEQEADTLLIVKLNDLSLQTIQFSPERSAMGEEYRMTVTASIALVDRRTQEVITEHPRVTGYADFLVTGDMTSSRQTAIPHMASDLARGIVQRVVEVW